jgi:predicted lipid carrier protein YhbT
MTQSPALPALVSRAAGLLPLFPLQHAVAYVLAQTVRRHAPLLERLAEQGAKVVAIVPTDLPVAFLVTIDPTSPGVEVVRDLDGHRIDSRISGTAMSLLDMVEGRLDGDALFFSRDLSVEGDVEAVVALRNAIDGEALNVLQDAVAPLGPFAAPAERIGRGAIDLMRALARRSTPDLHR